MSNVPKKKKKKPQYHHWFKVPNKNNKQIHCRMTCHHEIFKCIEKKNMKGTVTGDNCTNFTIFKSRQLGDKLFLSA